MNRVSYCSLKFTSNILYIFLCSCLPHKEFRFVFPALPLAMHYCGVFFQHLCSRPHIKKFKIKSVSRSETEPMKEDKDSSISESEKSQKMTSETENESQLKDCQTDTSDKYKEIKHLDETNRDESDKKTTTETKHSRTLDVSDCQKVLSCDKEQLIADEKNEVVQSLSPSVSMWIVALLFFSIYKELIFKRATPLNKS